MKRPCLETTFPPILKTIPVLQTALPRRKGSLDCRPPPSHDDLHSLEKTTGFPRGSSVSKRLGDTRVRCLMPRPPTRLPTNSQPGRKKHLGRPCPVLRRP